MNWLTKKYFGKAIASFIIAGLFLLLVGLSILSMGEQQNDSWLIFVGYCSLFVAFLPIAFGSIKPFVIIKRLPSGFKDSERRRK